jgi:hypothetical protein
VKAIVDAAVPRVENEGRTEAPATDQLLDWIVIAFNQACDQNDLDIAGRLLKLLELLAERRAPNLEGDRPRYVETISGAYVRLAQLLDTHAPHSGSP